MHRHITQFALVTLLALALVAGACGGGDDDSDSPTAAPEGETATAPAEESTEASPDTAGSPTATQPETSPTAAPSAEAAFPVTIEHKFGTTEIPAAPERVITVGFSEQDAVLALGVTPIAVREWFGEQPNATWPWAQDELGDGTPEVLTMPFGELDYELLASLAPDLIVATHSGITEDEYATLAAIAPVVAQTADYPDFGMPWQEQTRLIGQALGRAGQAEELVAGVEAAIAAVAEAHPAFAGATIAWASPGADGQYVVVGPNTPPMRFLTALGFTIPEPILDAVGDLDSGQVGGEQVRLLDVDVLIFQASSDEERAVLENDPLYQQLAVAAEGRTVFFLGLTDPIYGALSFSTVLSLPFAAEELAPILSAAVDGDPATEAP